MTKKELVTAVAESAGISSKDAAAVLEALAKTIHSTISSGGEVVLPSVGKFKLKERGARTRPDPKTGQNVEKPAGTVLGFKPAKVLRDAIS